MNRRAQTIIIVSVICGTLVLSRELPHIEPAIPQRQGSLWATSIAPSSGTAITQSFTTTAK